jgi:DNA-binding beta-propeller fold protein YncE
MNHLRKTVFTLALLGLLSAGVGAGRAWAAAAITLENTPPRTLVTFPDYGNTPMGMAIERNGDLLLASPNFNRPAYPGVLIKIDSERKDSFYFPMPVHPKTGRACPVAVWPSQYDSKLYVVDNQYEYDKNRASRLMVVLRNNDRPVRAVTVVEGLTMPATVVCYGRDVYVSDSRLNIPGKPGMGGIYRFSQSEINQSVESAHNPDVTRGTPIQITPGQDDPHLIAVIPCVPNARKDDTGAFGMTFDANGYLYCGNFGNGIIYKIVVKDTGKADVKEFVKDPRMSCAAGMFIDTRSGEIYVADTAANAVHAISPQGKLATVWQNIPTNGATGLLNRPVSVIVRGDDMVVSNSEITPLGAADKQDHLWHTLSLIMLNKLGPVPGAK